MDNHSRVLPMLALILVATLPVRSGFATDEAKQVGNPPQALTADDRKLLERLLTEFIFDPQGSEFVATAVKIPTAWGDDVEGFKIGWRVHDKVRQADRVCFIDGDSLVLTAGARVEKVDFFALCRKRYEEKKTPTADDDFREIFRKMQLTAVGMFETPDLVNAVWLRRLGKDNLAAIALQQARQPFQKAPDFEFPGEKQPPTADGRMIASLKRQLAESAYLTMVHSYMVRADEQALANGQRLFKLYPEHAKILHQADAVVAELHRRKNVGTFGKTPAEKLPKESDTWSVPKKLAYLIDALDEVDARQWAQPGGVALGWDWRVKALVGIGEAAVPGLIDAVEHDERLTRSVEFNRDFRLGRTVLPVRRAAFVAVLSILRVCSLDPTEEGWFVNLLDDKEKIQKTVAQLRAYWKANRGLALDERMMKVLTNPKASDNACREAAWNLVSSEDGYVEGPLGIKLPPSGNPPPAVAKFQNPTVGEAILAVFDRVMLDQEIRARKGGDYYSGPLPGVEGAYLGRLAALHDKRLAAEFHRRYNAAHTLHKRMVWAIAAHASGDAGPLVELAGNFRDGMLIIPGHDLGEKVREGEVGTTDLMDLIGCFTKIDLPETDRALFAATDSKHPLHDRIAQRIAATRPGTSPHSGEPFLEHPFCLAFLRRDLDNHAPTGGTYQIRGKSLDLGGPNYQSSSTLPEFLLDPATRRESAPELVCDRAAVLIDEIVFGMPLVHPLRKDHDERLKEMIALLDRYQGRFRRSSSTERQITGWQTPFIAGTATSGKSATVEDVKTGGAIFNLSGAGRPASIKLPAVGLLKQTQKDAKPEQVLIAQAEIDSEGKTVYGIIGRHFMRAAKADELTDIKAIEPPAR